MIKKKSFIYVLFIACISGFLTFKSAYAQQSSPSTSEARIFVETVGKRIIDLLTNKSLSRADQEKRFGEILDDHFDMNKIALFTLGRYKKQVTETQKIEFEKLFRISTIKSYVDRFKEYNNEVLVVGNAIVNSDKTIQVNSSVKQASGKNLDVQWRLYKGKGGRLHIFEVVVNGIGMALTKRKEYNPTLSKDGIDGLIGFLKVHYGSSLG